jgi:hypothetical protein
MPTIIKDKEMDKNYTDITILLDRSGSMYPIATDMQGAIDSFINAQTQLPGSCLVNLYHFDHELEEVFSNLPAKLVKPIELKPRGSTALLDSLGKTISRLGSRLARMPEEMRPGKVIFVIITDGLENASKEYNLPTVKQMIEDQTNKYNWQFLYIGANQDAFAEGLKFGLQYKQSYTFDPTRGSIEKMRGELISSSLNYRAGNTMTCDIS